MKTGDYDPKIKAGEGKVKMNLSKTSATSVSGAPVKYDGGSKYNDGKYYDKWYSASGDVTQPDEPKIESVV